MPPWDHTGTPLHFHSSTTSGSACLISVRSFEGICPRQSSSSLILSSINREGDLPFGAAGFVMLLATLLTFRAAGLLRLTFGIEDPLFELFGQSSSCGRRVIVV